MSTKIKITADSTCDLSRDLIEKYDIGIIPLYVNTDDKSFRDGVDITPDFIYDYVEKTGKLPKTSAIPIAEYYEYFKKFTDEGYTVIHINISSGFSSCYQNATIAANDLGNVFAVDSKNLSTGSGHVVLTAAKLVSDGNSPEEIIEKLNEIIPKVEASFIIDRLNYLALGGRCSSVAALGANLLQLKPCIEVVDGKMTVSKKFRGKYDKCIEEYVKFKLEGRDDIRDDLVFITHTKMDTPLYAQVAEKTINENYNFKEIKETIAGCTITTHCGPNTLGILFIRK